MSLASRLTRSPRPFDADRAAEIRDAFDDLPPEQREFLSGTAGCSPYLHGLIEREADWLRAILDHEPEATFEAILEAIPPHDAGELPAELRRAKRRVALLTALADLGGVWQLEPVTGALTRFADLATDRALKAGVAAEIRRGKLPGAEEGDVDTGAGMFALAMGKMGAGELNYSSDIDLICLFDESRFAEDDYYDARSGFIRATRKMAAMLSDMTAEGYVFRTDLRLRPDPASTPVCLAMDAAESYYESLGRTWERAAYIKARTAAGDLSAGEGFLKRLTPFVWRKHLDFAAIQDAHDMRLRIREHKGLHGPIALEGHDMKLGQGGIREIEFFTQTRQIIAGGRDTDLRVRGTVEGLARLAEKGWIPEDVAQTLTEDYRAHREVEHRLQMVRDAQTHTMPTTAEGIARIAAFMDRDEADLRREVKERLERVAELTEGFFAPGQSRPEPQMSATASEIVSRWTTYPALRSARAMEIFERLKPELLSRLQKSAKPDEALLQFDGFLSGLPAGVQLFSLFEASPQLVDLIVDISATAPALAQYLSRNSGVFDAVLDGQFFADWPGSAALEQRLCDVLAEIDDYEKKLDGARRWCKEWHFRIGVHHLRGVIGGAEAGKQYADLAGATLAALWPSVLEEFSAKHGAPPGRGAVVLGMGSLGAERLSATSDLDVIMIYDAAGVDFSEGRRPLAARAYYARLTQALVTAVTAPMAEGKLYEMDMRLRPSGRQGPVATSLDSFQTYQREEAWTWEHMALTRARPVAGCMDLGEEVEQFRRSLLAEPRDVAKIVGDTREMRDRLAEAKPGRGTWDPKQGAGRMMEIELVAQAGALLAGSPDRSVPGQLAAGAETGWLTEAEATALTSAYDLFGRVQMVSRLLSGGALDLEAVGQGGADFLLRETDARDIASLGRKLDATADGASDAVEAAFGRAPKVT